MNKPQVNITRSPCSYASHATGTSVWISQLTFKQLGDILQKSILLLPISAATGWVVLTLLQMTSTSNFLLIIATVFKRILATVNTSLIHIHIFLSTYISWKSHISNNGWFSSHDAEASQKYMAAKTYMLYVHSTSPDQDLWYPQTSNISVP